MGTEGMRTSLISREVITDSIELVTRGNLFDALIVLVGCDKTIPAGIMALARLNIPASFSTAARSPPANLKAIPSRFRTFMKPLAAIRMAICPTRLKALEETACPGAGACGGQFTANTMALVCEFLGIAPMGLSQRAATDSGKAHAGHRAGELVMDLLRGNIAIQNHYESRDRKCHRRSRCHRRFDEFRSTPARDCQRSAHSAEHR